MIRAAARAIYPGTAASEHGTIGNMYKNGLLIGWSERGSLLRWLEFLLHRFRKQRFGQPRRTPDLELDVVTVVDTVCEEDGGQIDVGEVASSERSQAVLGQVLDPFVSWAIIKVRIIGQISCMVMTAHGDEQTAW